MAEHKHPIKVVSQKTGLSPHVIRVWERRYGAVTPDRTDTNRRLYSDADIDRLILLHRATDMGESISQIAGMSRGDLVRLVSPARAELPAPQEREIDIEASADVYFERALKAVRNFDAVLLEAILVQASRVFKREDLIKSIIMPLLNETGRLWRDCIIKVSHEHLASAAIRSLLGNMIASTVYDEIAPVIVSTTPAGAFHEFGALMAAVTAGVAGWRVIYLGPNIPAEDISAAAVQAQAAVVALSIAYPFEDFQIKTEIERLRILIPGETMLIVGGRAASSYGSTINAVGAELIENFDNLRNRLDIVRISRDEKENI